MSKTITVVLIMPQQNPEMLEIANELRELQTLVGGNIEAFYPFEDKPFVCFCNDEGKLNGMEPNWAWISERSFAVNDVIAGPIVVCGDTADGTERSLTKSEIEFVVDFFSRNRCIDDIIISRKFDFSRRKDKIV